MRDVAFAVGAVGGFFLFLLIIGPMIPNGDLRAFGIGVSVAAGAMIGEKLFDRWGTTRRSQQ